MSRACCAPRPTTAVSTSIASGVENRMHCRIALNASGWKPYGLAVRVIGKLVEPEMFGWFGSVGACEPTVRLIVPVIVLPECDPLNVRV